MEPISLIMLDCDSFRLKREKNGLWHHGPKKIKLLIKDKSIWLPTTDNDLKLLKIHIFNVQAITGNHGILRKNNIFFFSNNLYISFKIN